MLTRRDFLASTTAAAAVVPALSPSSRSAELWLQRTTSPVVSQTTPATSSRLLIASLAADIGAPVWSLDDDVVRMERLGLASR